MPSKEISCRLHIKKYAKDTITFEQTVRNHQRIGTYRLDALHRHTSRCTKLGQEFGNAFVIPLEDKDLNSNQAPGVIKFTEKELSQVHKMLEYYRPKKKNVNYTRLLANFLAAKVSR